MATRLADSRSRVGDHRLIWTALKMITSPDDRSRSMNPGLGVRTRANFQLPRRHEPRAPVAGSRPRVYVTRGCGRGHDGRFVTKTCLTKGPRRARRRETARALSSKTGVRLLFGPCHGPRWLPEVSLPGYIDLRSVGFWPCAARLESAVICISDCGARKVGEEGGGGVGWWVVGGGWEGSGSGRPA